MSLDSCDQVSAKEKQQAVEVHQQQDSNKTDDGSHQVAQMAIGIDGPQHQVQVDEGHDSEKGLQNHVRLNAVPLDQNRHGQPASAVNNQKKE